jgi:GntR family transcriptional regulator / MocR family aminotransferase
MDTVRMSPPSRSARLPAASSAREADSGNPPDARAEREGFPPDVLVDLRSEGGRGLRERLEHGLRAAIQSRRIVAGTPLPATRVLAAELGISRSVVVAAYANLAADGYLEARQGAGTRVRGGDGLAERRRRDRGAGPGPARERRRAAPGEPRAIPLVGGLPDPALFPRATWARHYRAALAEMRDLELSYPEILGAPALRRALTAYLGRVRGVATDPERVLVCGGFTQGLTLLCRALRRAGARRVALEDPCFGLHRRAIAMAGLEPVPVPVDPRGLDVAGLARHDVSAVLVAPAHSYPSGGTLDARRRHQLVAWARRHDALIIEDDYDAEFRYDRVPIGALQGLAPDRVAHIGSASKTLSPSLRLGWVAAPPDLVGALEDEKRVDDMGTGLLEQHAFARFVDGGDFARHLRRVRPAYRARRDAAVAALAESVPAARPQGAAGGLHLHVMLPEDVDEGALAAAAGDRGVRIEPAAWHWAEPALAPPSIVLGYGGLAEPALRRGIALLGEALAAVRGTRGQPGPTGAGPRAGERRRDDPLGRIGI